RAHSSTRARRLRRLALGGDELHGSRVHAVAQPRRLRAVLEDVAEMAAAARADDLDPAHEPGVVDVLVDRLLVDGGPEARPARAGLELRVGAEELLAAAGAHVGALGVIVPGVAGEG